MYLEDQNYGVGGSELGSELEVWGIMFGFETRGWGIRVGFVTRGWVDQGWVRN